MGDSSHTPADLCLAGLSLGNDSWVPLDAYRGPAKANGTNSSHIQNLRQMDNASVLPVHYSQVSLMINNNTYGTDRKVDLNDAVKTFCFLRRFKGFNELPERCSRIDSSYTLSSVCQHDFGGAVDWLWTHL
jgi:hypothetical protein